MARGSKLPASSEENRDGKRDATKLLVRRGRGFICLAWVTKVMEGSVKVLHVDDDEDFVEMSSEFLERKGNLDVTTETSASDALDALGEKTVDCLVSDYDMPGTDGIELLEEVRSEYPSLPFILFTGKGSEDVASEAISKGVTDYMQKETGTDQYDVLANRIENVTEASRFHQELEATQSKHRRLLEQSLVGVYLIRNGEIRYANSKLADIFGYTREEMIGKPVSSLVAEEDRDLVKSNIQRRLQGEVESIRYAFRGKRSDGTVIDVEAHGGRVETDGPAVMGTLMRLDEDRRAELPKEA